MISEKEYLKLMKRLTAESPDADMNKRILESCGLTGTESTGSSRIAYKISYGLSFFVILIAVLTTGINLETANSSHYINTANNSKILAQQISGGTYMLFTGSNINK